MLRRAEWRVLPNDPKTPFAWWRREVRSSISATAVALLISSIIVGICLLLKLGLFAIIAIPIGYLLNRTISENALLSLSAQLADLAPSPAPAEVFAVQFSFYTKSLCTGTDRGIASVVEGWLHVEGLHTSFSLRPADLWNVEAPSGTVCLFELIEGQVIEIHPLSNSRADRETFHETIRVWRNFPFALPKGEPLLPPLALHGSAFVRPKAALVCGRILIAILLLCGIFGFLIFGYFVLPVIAVAIVSSLSYFQKINADARTLTTLEAKSLP